MKAAIFRGARQPLTIEEVAIASPNEREVLVRTVSSGVCRSDLHFIEGLYPFPTPAVLGHEAAGIVEQVGSGATYLQPGDHVIACRSVFCGYCEDCMSGHPARCANRTATRRRKDARPRLSQNGKPLSNSREEPSDLIGLANTRMVIISWRRQIEILCRRGRDSPGLSAWEDKSHDSHGLIDEVSIAVFFDCRGLDHLHKVERAKTTIYCGVE